MTSTIKRGSLGLFVQQGQQIADCSIEFVFEKGTLQNIIMDGEDRAGRSGACCIASFSPTKVDFEGFNIDRWIAIDFNEDNQTPGAVWFEAVVSIKTPENHCTIYFDGLHPPYDKGIVLGVPAGELTHQHHVTISWDPSLADVKTPFAKSTVTVRPLK